MIPNIPVVYSLRKEVWTAATNAMNFGSVCPLDRDDPHPKGEDSRERIQIREDRKVNKEEENMVQ